MLSVQFLSSSKKLITDAIHLMFNRKWNRMQLRLKCSCHVHFMCMSCSCASVHFFDSLSSLNRSVRLSVHFLDHSVNIPWTSETTNISSVSQIASAKLSVEGFKRLRVPLRKSWPFFCPIVTYEREFTVSGQNKIGRELTLLALIQPTVIKQQAVNNNSLWKL